MSGTAVITNSAKNLTLPFSAGTNAAIGGVEYITIEVLVDMILRMILRAPKRGVFQLAVIHALTLPMIGGITRLYGDAPIDYSGGSLLDQTKDGASGIPAVFLAQYVYSSAFRGFYIPRGFSMRDILVTALAKTVSKPLISSVWRFLPQAMVKDTLSQLNSLFRAEVRASNLGKAMGGGRA